MAQQLLHLPHRHWCSLNHRHVALLIASQQAQTIPPSELSNFEAIIAAVQSKSCDQIFDVSAVSCAQFTIFIFTPN